MKKLIVSLVAAGAMVGVANADYMKWTVDNSSLTSVTQQGSSGGTQDVSGYAFAVLVQSDDATHIETTVGYARTDPTKMQDTYVGNYNGTTKAVGSSVFADGSTIVASAVGDTARYFYIELYSSTGDLMAYTTSGVDLSTATQFRETSQFSANWSSMNAFSGTFTAVPEPTSGVMLLVGAALVGLRRRRFGKSRA